MKKLLITFGSITTLFSTFSAIACKQAEESANTNPSKSIDEINNKIELKEGLGQTFDNIMAKYNNDLFDKIKLNEQVTQDDFEFLKKQLEIFNKLMQSSLLNDREKDINFPVSVSYLNFSNDMTNEELGEMNETNPDAEYFSPKDIIVNEWVEEILANKRTSVTRFQWAIIGDFVGEVIADIGIDEGLENSIS
ncbi:hypothetical protein ACM0IS_02765 [Mycoplasma aquilae ATCC BAA-1896]|uniref:hypothetical protein n=1 Tax=Mycoplasma aquilae TaxID=1312741 RepID=UPI003A8A7F72